MEAERVVGGREVVVDRLRDCDHRDAEVAETLGDPERAVAADGDDALDPELADPLDDLSGAIDAHALSLSVERWIFERIAAIRRPQERPALRQDAADGLGRQGNGVVRQQPLEPKLDPEHFHVVVARGRAHRCADHSVESGTVSAARENADSFHHLISDQITYPLLGERRAGGGEREGGRPIPRKDAGSAVAPPLSLLAPGGADAPEILVFAQDGASRTRSPPPLAARRAAGTHVAQPYLCRPQPRGHHLED